MLLKSKLFGVGLTGQILLALIVGLIVGLILNMIGPLPLIQDFLVDGAFQLGGKIFFSLLKYLVVPVVFISLICGTAAVNDIKRMGRIGGKIFGYYLLTTALAISLALLVALVLAPGQGFNLSTATQFSAQDAPSFVETVINLFPSNLFKAMSDGEMLQIIVAAILIGVSLNLAGASGQRVLSFFQDLNEVIMNMVALVMWVAPIGVFCLIARVFATQGFAAIAPLSMYFSAVVLALLLHGLLVYPALLVAISGLKPLTFFRKFREVLIFAFSTSSSNATLPVTLEVAEHKMGVDNKVASFTLPLGATINMDGTAIMQGVATVFIAQAYGIDIGLNDFITVILTATLASIGTAGVPGVGLVTLALVLRQANLPVEGIGLIIGVDRLLDMARTAVNVLGDAIGTVIVAKSEKQLSVERFYQET